MAGSSIVQVAKKIKHAQHVARKRVLPAAPGFIRDLTWRSMDRIVPPVYRPGSHHDSFISATPKASPGDVRPLPIRAFTLWTGGNAMTPNRQRALEEMRARLRMPLHLVTPDNLGEWLVADSPLHPSYDDLCLVHRSDYLRAYLLHHHGGVYLDLKPGYGDVDAAADRLAGSPQHWFSGYRYGSDYVSDEPGTIHRALRRHHGTIPGTAAFAARPATPLTTEWLAEVHRRLDRLAGALRTSPAGPDDPFGRAPDYPVSWIELLGGVLQPLCLKYSERVLISQEFIADFDASAYR